MCALKSEWLLNARSDMQRRMDELEISKEWIDVHGEEIDLQALNNQLIIRRTQVNNAHKLEKRRADLEQEYAEAQLKTSTSTKVSRSSKSTSFELDALSSSTPLTPKPQM